MSRPKTKSKELILQQRPKSEETNHPTLTRVGQVPSRPVTQDADWIVSSLKDTLTNEMPRVTQIRLESKKGRARTAATVALEPKSTSFTRLNKRDYLMMAIGAYSLFCLKTLIELLVTYGQ